MQDISHTRCKDAVGGPISSNASCHPVSIKSVTGLIVTTDCSIDCSSLETIVHGVCRDAMTPQEKAIALYDFVRRLMFHFPNRVDSEAVHDTLHLLNTYGYSLCSQQAMIAVQLWNAAGLSAKVWSAPHHSTSQVAYAGQDHWFDLLVGGYVYHRDGETIASLQDIASDPTLLLEATEEGRVPQSFTPCGHALKDDARRFAADNPDNFRYCNQFEGDVDHMAEAARVAEPWQWGDPQPSRYKPGVSLRAGESIDYLWDFIPAQANCNVLELNESPRAYWVTQAELPPHHICGAEAEDRDQLNAEVWRRYRKQVTSVETGRYAANGRHLYQIDFSGVATVGDWIADGFIENIDRAHGPVLYVAEASRSATLTCRLSTPHIYTGGMLSVQFVRATDQDISQVYVSPYSLDSSSSRTQQQRTQQQRTLLWDATDVDAPSGLIAAEISLDQVIRNTRDLCFELVCGTSGPSLSAGLSSFRFDGIFQHNMFARPHLVNGLNQVTIRSDHSGVCSSPLHVTHVWREGDGERSHTESVIELPCTYTIGVGGDTPPRMLRMAMSR